MATRIGLGIARLSLQPNKLALANGLNTIGSTVTPVLSKRNISRHSRESLCALEILSYAIHIGAWTLRKCLIEQRKSIKIALCSM